MSFDPSTLPPGLEIPGQQALVAHAAVMCLVFVLFLPTAALTTRAPVKVRVMRLHAPWQAFNVILAIAGMALGTSVASTRGIPKRTTSHILLGYLIVGLMFAVQPVLGILQHLHFRKANRRGIWGWAHLLLGRLIVILGLVNGVTGFKLARDDTTAVYFASLGIVSAVYIAILLWDWLGPRYKARKAGRTGDQMEMNPPESQAQRA